MASLAEVSDWIAASLPGLIEEYDVPAAAVGVLADGRIVDHAAGVLSMSTGVEATTDSVFQIGSITKLWTASLVMQLVDEGRVDLDATIRTYLPEFTIADEAAAKAITVRQLLTHTSGFEGDFFTDTGLGDDCVEKFLGTLHDVPQLFPPGTMWSYNNAGFSVLGRLVEVLRGKPYDTALREHLIKPLGITHAATSPYEAILFRAAVGHVENTPGPGFHPTPVWALTRSNAPAGAMFATSVRGLLTFAQMHLSDGRAPDGSRILAPGTAGLMQDRQVDLPQGAAASSWGLGFERSETSSGVLVGHSGATLGQNARLWMAPSAGVSVAILTNGGNFGELFRDVAEHVMEGLAGVRPEPEPLPPEEPEPIDASKYIGTYRCDESTTIVSQEPDGSVWLENTPTNAISQEIGEEAHRWELVHLQDESLITRERFMGRHIVATFVGADDGGRSKYLYFGGRATPRVQG